MINGKQFVDRIDALQNEVWIEGKRCEDKLSESAPFKGIIASKAELYDYQCCSEQQELFSYTTHDGEKYGFSYHQPQTVEDLINRRKATQSWARLNGGLVGRPPDYMNTLVMALAAASPHLSKGERPLGENMKALYELAKSKDLSITHTFINPQVNRSISHYLDDATITAAKVIEENKDGIVIHGAKLLATQGGLTDELLVLPSGQTLDESFIFGFMIPSNTKGLRFLCRESYRYRESSFDHPLAARFEEGDSLVVFDNVLVPWNRVIIYKDFQVLSDLDAETGMYAFLQYQAVCRQVVKLEFLLGLCEAMCDAIQISEFEHVKLKMTEIIVSLEIMRALLLSSEVNSEINRYGTRVPDSKPLRTANNYFAKTYPRLIEITQLLGASSMISLPTEDDFESKIKGDLGQYLQGANIDAKERVKLFRIAWDIGMSAFGSRQTQFERFFFGDPIRLSTSFYNSYPKQAYHDMVQDFLNSKK
ncbi:4-hydroxyphenylacetate 3-monooxygenase, oxygenase component [Alkalihalobacillus sp. CinArs1]|uniref:4-hydroxyphenylacetate 3-monooxygenase, oxygenase component n=1 Tax=Alkalihalobacillus sp. CinArs1 TaxID=2995314 RepID=UPI0022DDBFD1|nr:4-hydroxyphenylacetate 3-monooxygenase, oxygenase component [Alkalihalobacillus sp. CinArs1]